MKKTRSKGSLLGAAATVAGVVAGAGAYYFYGSKDAKKHRQHIASWMKSAEKEIVSEVKKLKEAAFNEKNVKKIVATVSKKYQTLKNIDKKDVAAFAETIGAAWKDMEKDFKKGTKVAKKVVTKSAKVVKKAVKKAVKKK